MNSNEKMVDLRVAPAQGSDVSCATCKQVVPLYEVFDGWESGLEHETCPRCQGALLPPLVTA